MMCISANIAADMAAFVFEITDKVKYDADNRILVKVNNALQQDVMPLVGDFNFYGGIYGM